MHLAEKNALHAKLVFVFLFFYTFSENMQRIWWLSTCICTTELVVLSHKSKKYSGVEVTGTHKSECD